MNIKFFATFIIRSIAACSAMVMHLSVARTLAPAEAGIFYIVFTIITLLSVVSRLGFDEVVLKNISKFWHNKEFYKLNSIYKTAFLSILIASIIGACFLVFAGLLMSVYIYPEMGWVMVAMSPSLIFTSLYFIHAQMLQGRLESIKSTLVLGLISQFLFSLLIFIIPSKNAISASLCLNLSTFVAFLVGLIAWNSKKYTKWKSVGYLNVKESCMALWIVAIIQQATVWGGQLIGAFFMIPNEIAVFNVFQRITTVLQFFLLFASLVFSPKIAALYAQNKKVLLQELIYKINFILLVVCILAAVSDLFGGYVIEFVLGKEYSKYIIVFHILFAGQLVNTLLGFSFFILTMCGKEKELRDIIIKTFLFAVLLNILFSYFLGVIGISIISVVMVSVQNILCVRVMRNNMGMKMWRI